MRDWLTYTIAFVIGMGVALMARYLAFSVVISTGGTFSMVGFIGFVILLPVLVGAFVLGMIYAKAVGDRFTGAEWLIALGFTFAATIMSVGLILSRAMSEVPAMILLFALIFAGGRVLLARRNNG